VQEHATDRATIHDGPGFLNKAQKTGIGSFLLFLMQELFGFILRREDHALNALIQDDRMKVELQGPLAELDPLQILGPIQLPLNGIRSHAEAQPLERSCLLIIIGHDAREERHKVIADFDIQLSLGPGGGLFDFKITRKADDALFNVLKNSL
jgi:hypothetical protein